MTTACRPLAVLGVGAMGSALVRAWLGAQVVTAADLRVHDPAPDRAAALAADYGLTVAPSPAAAAAGARALLLAVKPADAAAALRAAAPAPGTLIISIAAGVSLATLAAAAPGCPLVRVMPNTPALVGAGASALALGDDVSDEQAAAATALFEAVGLAVRVPETLLDAATGLSGSGPAYIFVLIEALADAGVREGLPRDTALRLAAQTTLGAAKLVLESGEHPGLLKDRVCSPGGTTIAGVAALETQGFRAAAQAAVAAATQRAREL